MKKIGLFAALLILLLSCAKTVQNNRYYLLEYNTTPKNILETPLTQESCEIFTVQVSDVYASHRIAVRTRSHEVDYYHYHQWAQSPALNIGQLVHAHIQKKNLFKQFAARIWNVSPRYQIYCTIQHMEVVDKETHLEAHFNMQLELFDRQTEQVVAKHYIDKSEPLANKDMNLFARKVSAFLKTGTEQFITEIESHLTR